jgi:DUF4097 and DUF4098 domain-containing protein YvlB
MHNRLRWNAGRALAGALLLLPLAGAARAEFTREFTFPAGDLRIANLIGQVDVRGHAGKEYRVTVNVRGEDATEARIRFDERAGGLVVQFPLDETRRYVYPAIGRRSRTTFSGKSSGHDSWLEDLIDLASGRIEVRGDEWSDALEIWADVTVDVPTGSSIRVELGVGEMDATGIQGKVDLLTHSGAVGVENVKGSVEVDTGSGSVVVTNVRGDVSIDTGSGSVRIGDVREATKAEIDTGSGSVVVEDFDGGKLLIDTGSGSVDLEGASVRELAIDTGSGGVDAFDLACDEAQIETGSGGVEVEFTRMGEGRYEIDTGSGGIRLRVPRDISAEFDVETGSGGIDVDIDGVSLGRRERREGDARFTVGGGGSSVRLSTGSGTVRIIQARSG